MKQNIEAKIIKAIGSAIEELRDNKEYKNIKEISKLKLKKHITTENAGVRSHWLNERQILIVIEIEKEKKQKLKVGSLKVEENRKKREIYKKYKGLPKELVDEYYL